MGKVAVLFRVVPESPETDINVIKQKIEKIVSVKDFRVEPLAFGINQLKILVVSDDKEGLGNIEDKLKKISGVASAEVESVTLI
jgi:elongation factor 1-beta